MVVTLFQEDRTRLCLRARPPGWIIAPTLLIVAGASIWLTRNLETTDGKAVVLPSDWSSVVVSLALFAAIGMILDARTWCTLDIAAGQITIERGLFRRKKACVSLAQLDRIAIRQRETSADYNYVPFEGPDELHPVQTTLVLALILKTGEELEVVQRMPGGTEGMSVVRQLESFRKMGQRVGI